MIWSGQISFTGKFLAGHLRIGLRLPDHPTGGLLAGLKPNRASMEPSCCARALRRHPSARCRCKIGISGLHCCHPCHPEPGKTGVTNHHSTGRRVSHWTSKPFRPRQILPFVQDDTHSLSGWNLKTWILPRLEYLVYGRKLFLLVRQ